jgi:uncharacterized membrane protein
VISIRFHLSLVAALLLAAAVLLAYHFYLERRERREPGFATHGFNALARARWVNWVMQEGNQGILAVQTLRNSVMAASIMASTAILLVIGTLNLGSSGAALERLLGAVATGPSGTEGDHALLLLLLMADFFVAFFFFSMAIRFYNHVGYMISAGGAESSFASQRVAAFLNRAGRFYSLGTRAFYMCVPLVFGLFGPLYLVAAALGLVAALNRIDRLPAPQVTEPGC